jgi:signal transduction histidine kinase
VKKHSGADEAVVRLSKEGRNIVLLITDAGIGFDEREPAFKAGLGLRSMRERLRAVGGTIEIQSRRGGGTQVFARAPLPSEHA